MKDQDLRHLDDAGSGVPAILRSALGAARAASPDDAQLERLAARLPFGTPSPPAAPPAAGGAGAAAAAPSVLSGALVGAALGVVVSVAGLFWPATRAPSPPAAPLVVAPVVAGGEPAARIEAPPAPTVPEAAASASPSALPRPSPPAASASAPPSAEEAAPPVPAAGVGAVAPDTETEAHLLERAQDALGATPALALALTGEHASRFPGGALGQEREVVAVQALLRLGRGEEARARVARFVSAFPGSAHRRRLEALVGP